MKKILGILLLIPMLSYSVVMYEKPDNVNSRTVENGVLVEEYKDGTKLSIKDGKVNIVYPDKSKVTLDYDVRDGIHGTSDILDENEQKIGTITMYRGNLVYENKNNVIEKEYFGEVYNKKTDDTEMISNEHCVTFINKDKIVKKIKLGEKELLLVLNKDLKIIMYSLDEGKLQEITKPVLKLDDITIYTNNGKLKQIVQKDTKYIFDDNNMLEKVIIEGKNLGYEVLQEYKGGILNGTSYFKGSKTSIIVNYRDGRPYGNAIINGDNVKIDENGLLVNDFLYGNFAKEGDKIIAYEPIQSPISYLLKSSMFWKRPLFIEIIKPNGEVKIYNSISEYQYE